MEGKREILNLKKERKEKYLDTFVRKVKYCKISLGPSGNRSQMGPGLLQRRLYENGCFSKKISTTTAINEQNVLSLTPYFRSGIRSFLSHFSRLFSNSLSLFNCISFLHLLSSISFFEITDRERES